jgi:hypothetical protein
MASETSDLQPGAADRTVPRDRCGNIESVKVQAFLRGCAWEGSRERLPPPRLLPQGVPRCT